MEEKKDNIFSINTEFLINNGLHCSLLSIDKLYDYILTKNKSCNIYEFIKQDYERLFFIDYQFTIFNSNFISISYSWSSNIKDLITSLMVFSKKVNINYLWMDAFCIDQYDIKSRKAGLKAINYVYQKATYHLCINLRSLERLWCQYELAMRQNVKPNSTMFLFSDNEKELILKNNINELIRIYNFSFNNCYTTFTEDREYIENEINSHFKSVDIFDKQFKSNYMGAIYRYKEINKINDKF